MARGRGVQLQSYKDGGLSDAKVFTRKEGLSWRLGERVRVETDLAPWRGNRAGAGRMPPNGFPRGNRFYMTCFPFEGRLAHQTLGMLLTRLYTPLTMLANAHMDIMSAVVSFERVFEVLDLEPLLSDAPDAVDRWVAVA